MFILDHDPPHFHAFYAGRKMRIEIETERVMSGRLAPSAERLVEQWRQAHVEELAENWARLQTGGRIIRIEGLR